MDPSAYWEASRLSLKGNIPSPALKNVSRAVVDIVAEPTKDDYWSSNPTIQSAKAIGFVEKPRDEEILKFYCSVPTRLSSNIHVAVAAGKIKHISISGTKLKYRMGSVISLALSTVAEERE